ncbi:MAG: hypothetical protein ACXACT_18435 [Candidatus Thorarchaeota archaeon]|jgi:hypothetical protein
MANQFIGYDNIVPLVAPVAGTTGTITSPYVDLRNANKASFLVMFGAITSTTTTDEMVITVECATAEGGTEATIGYRYRLSAAVGANTWGAVASCASTGFGLGADDSDNMSLWVQVDPDELAANDYRYARVLATPSPASQMEAYVISIAAILEARYKQTTHISATASASA